MAIPHVSSPGAVSASGRVERDEALWMLRDAPLLDLGRRAFDAKRLRHGSQVTYVHNRQVNPTNLCIHSCKFCDFAAKPGDEHAYVLSEAEILAMLADPALSEVHMVGGLWHTWGFSRAVTMVQRIREVRPYLWIKAFTAVEVDYYARMERTDAQAILTALRDAGVDAMPGGGAEVLSDRVHAALFPHKTSPRRWLDIHETCHRLGLPSNATLLFGHIETDEEIVDHLLSLRALQDRTHGFVSFVPLAYQPGRSGLRDRLVSAPHCLRIVALSRLVLDNIPHIKAYWPSLGVETAAASVSFGADDLDGTLGRERIMQSAGSEAPAALTRVDLERMVRDAGQTPVERDGRYQVRKRVLDEAH